MALLTAAVVLEENRGSSAQPMVRTAFDLKWVHPTEPPSEPFLGTGDIQPLADLGNSYATIEEMSIAPITKMLTVQLAVQAGVPLIPVIILGTPTTELVNAILKMVV
jgi:hypothetical protein